MQVAILLSRFVTSTNRSAYQGPASISPHPEPDVSNMGDVQESCASVQRSLESVVKALAANGINI